MAFFGISQETIGSISPIEGADKIVKATLKGVDFSFVVGKDTWRVGDTCLYIPIDSILPVPIQEKLGVVGKLAGKQKDRVKTVKLKGVLSQGLVAPMSLLEGMGGEKTPESIAEYLGIIKYEPPVLADKAGNLKPLPAGLSVYDIEGCERYNLVVEALMDQNIYNLEKLEGSNGSVTYDINTQKVYVNQRRFTIEEIDGHEHSWWAVARKQRFIDFVTDTAKRMNKTVTIYFEVCGPGIQGNIYHLSQVEGYIFDVKIGDSFISKPTMFDMLDIYFGIGKYKHAPILFKGGTLRDWLCGKSVKEASSGLSQLFGCLREGIVITPEEEQYNEHLGGRLILKQRDPIYLSKNEN